MSNYLRVGTLPTMLKSPRQASDIFSQDGRLPKQRHVFLVRFTPTGTVKSKLGALTFKIKNVDRPSIQPHVEELNQYNKKRQVYTGYKTNPVKVSLFDDADSSALKLWQEYSRYYFGDFSQAATSYAYDVTTPEFLDNGKAGFGFTAANGKNTGTNGQFFFKTIEILHIYSGVYDKYTLYNPRIASFEPDEMDYGEAGISMINMTFAYEALHIDVAMKGASTLPEFAKGTAGDFNGQDFHIPGTETAVPPVVPAPITQTADPGAVAQLGGANMTPLAVLLALPDNTANVAALEAGYRMFNTGTSGALSIFGGFSFGIGGFGVNVGLNSAGGLGVSVSLGLGFGSGLTQVDGTPSDPATFPSNLYNVTSATVAGAVQGAALTTEVATSLVAGVVGAASVAGTDAGLVNASEGVMLSPTAYGLINVGGTGAAQYGYNPYSAASVGFQGAGGTSTAANGLGATLTQISAGLAGAASPGFVPVTAISRLPAPATLASNAGQSLTTVAGTIASGTVVSATLTAVAAKPDLVPSRASTATQQRVAGTLAPGSVSALSTVTAAGSAAIALAKAVAMAAAYPGYGSPRQQAPLGAVDAQGRNTLPPAADAPVPVVASTDVPPYAD